MARTSNKSTSQKGATTKKKTPAKKIQSEASAAVDKVEGSVKAEVKAAQVDVKKVQDTAQSKGAGAQPKATAKAEDNAKTSSAATKETKGAQSAATNDAKHTVTDRPIASAEMPKRGNGIVWLALLFSLGGLAAGGYAYYQSILNQQATGSKVSTIGSQIASLTTEQQSASQAISSVGERIDQVEKSVTQQFGEVTTDLSQSGEAIELLQKQTTTIAKQAAPLAEQSKSLEAYAMQLQAQLAESINARSAQFGQTAAKWHEQEFASILSAVEHNLAWTGDTAQAVEGLSLLGGQLGDAKYAPVTEQLNSALTALKAVPVLDLDRTYSQLAALSSQVIDLPFMQDTALRLQKPKSASIDSAQVAKEATQLSSLKSAGKKLFADLGNLVKIQNIDKTPSVKLDFKAKFMVNESMRLNLKAAQLAILSKNENLFKVELSAAVTAAGEYFDPAAEQVSKWTEEVNDLSLLQLRPTIPDISGVKAAFDKVVARE